MFFLLNTMVIRTQLQLELPPGLERLARMTAAEVVSAGSELYRAHPRLERDRPDIARWYATLLEDRFPEKGGILFLKSGEAFIAQLLDVPLPELIRLHSLQEAGIDILSELRAGVWREQVAA